MTEPTYAHIAQPLQLRHRTLRNRVNFAAHTANMSEGGLPGDRHLATTNVSETMVTDELMGAGFERPVHVAGDAVAARLAVHAIYEGRVCGQRI